MTSIDGEVRCDAVRTGNMPKPGLPVIRDNIQRILMLHDMHEKQLCELLDITYQCYWQRFKNNTWRNEHVYAMCYVLSIITDDMLKPEMIVDGI